MILHRSGMVDKFLSLYLQHLWSTDAGIFDASTVVAAIQHFRPRVRGCLKESWRLLHAWRKEEKASNATPATPLVGYGVANMLEHRGFLGRAASLAAGYDGLMRGAEMASSRLKDVTFCHKKAIIKLAFTTTLSYRRADSELTLISHPLAIRLLRTAIRSCATDQVSLDEPVCACSVSALRAHVMRLLDELQLNNMVCLCTHGAKEQQRLTFSSMKT